MKRHDHILVVGFAGKKFAGKTTAANIINNTLLGAVRIHSFAAPLKEHVQGLFDFSDYQMSNPIAKELVDERWGCSPRQALQVIGTNAVRNQLCPNFWVRRMRHKLNELKSPTVVLIDDVRFKDEAELILDEYNELSDVFYLNCPELPDSSNTTDLHESERFDTALANPQQILNTKESFDSLRLTLRDAGVFNIIHEFLKEAS